MEFWLGQSKGNYIKILFRGWIAHLNILPFRFLCRKQETERKKIQQTSAVEAGFHVGQHLQTWLFLKKLLAVSLPSTYTHTHYADHYLWLSENITVVTSHLPGNMGAGIDEDRLKVFGELGSFLLAVLDDIIGQIQERQLPVAFSWRTHKIRIFQD